MRSYVLDANALLIFPSNRPGALRVGKILKDASREGSPAVMSAVNWGEVIYSLWKIRGEAETNAAIANTEMLPLAIVPADRRKATRAAELFCGWPYHRTGCDTDYGGSGIQENRSKAESGIPAKARAIFPQLNPFKVSIHSCGNNHHFARCQVRKAAAGSQSQGERQRRRSSILAAREKNAGARYTLG